MLDGLRLAFVFPAAALFPWTLVPPEDDDEVIAAMRSREIPAAAKGTKLFVSLIPTRVSAHLA